MAVRSDAACALSLHVVSRTLPSAVARQLMDCDMLAAEVPPHSRA